MTNPSGLHRSDVDDGFWTSCVESRIPVPSHGAASPSKVYAKRIASLDIEVARMEAGLVLAKKRRNMNLPSSRLPPECLQRIFMLVRDIWPPYRKEPTQKQYVSGWAAITHVCSNWREIALSVPSLWADLSCTALHSDSFNEMLRRSKLAPLSLHFNMTSSEDPYVLSFWLANVPAQRTESISITALSSSTSSLQLISYLSKHEWPILKGLRLVSDSKTTNHRLAQPLFEEGWQPNLTTLTLQSFMFEWPCQLSLGDIQILELALAGTNSTADASLGFLPTAQQLTEVLRAMHSPRIIELVNMFHPHGAFTEELRLPNSLRRLLLSTFRKDQSASCAQLWSRIIVPLGASVIIDVRKLEDGLLGTLREGFLRPQSGFQSQSSEVVIGNGSILLFGSETFKSPLPIAPNPMINQCVEWFNINDWNAGPNAFFNLRPSSNSVSTFHKLVNFASTRVIHVSRGALQTCDDPSHWLQSFSGASCVERVVLPVIIPSMSLLHAMARTGNSSGVGSFMLFPRLRTLTLHYKDDRIPDHELPLVVSVLIHLIHVRQEGRSPIQALQVSTSPRNSNVWLSVANEVPITWF